MNLLQPLSQAMRPVPLCLVLVGLLLAPPPETVGAQVQARAPAASSETASSETASSETASSELVEGIRNRIEAGRAAGTFVTAGRTLRAVQALPAFYVERGFEPAWIRNGRPSREARALVQAVRAAEEEGLRSQDYHAEALDSLLRAPGTGGGIRRLVDLELLLTDAFLVYGSHLLHGRVDPVGINPEWLANRRGADFARILEEALSTGRISQALEGLKPDREGYRLLRDELARLRTVAEEGGWEVVPPGPTLRRGDEGIRVAALRSRLRVSGDLEAAGTSVEVEEDRFDAALEEAVRHFQERHGLEADGLVGAATVAALNVPAEERARQIEVNMERWRWLPQDLGRRHILVNLAGFQTDVVEEGEVVLRLRSIVGREFRQSPVFTGRMTYLVLSPYWHVPPGIAANDLFPRIRQDPGVVAAERMSLLSVPENRAVDPHSVDWSQMTGGEFNRRFRLRQDPGPHNALGRVKFMFPNRHNVYLHDTPGQQLFARTERAFSSGCIRVERALELADYLLRDDPSWTPERIRTAANRTVETTVRLGEAVPVHIQYWTAWISDEGILQFRRDLYQRDPPVRRALTAAPPGP